MPLPIKDQAQIKADILRDILNQLPEAAVGTDSDLNIRASATSSAIEGLYQHQSFIVRQIFPDMADIDYMMVHAALRRIVPKPATNAVGTIAFTGVAGSAIPIGTEAKTTAGVAYVTTAAAVLDGAGQANVQAQALLPGVEGNAAVDTQLTLTAAPTGVASAALIVQMVAGTDVETDASVLQRLLDVLRNPPASGNNPDYRRWAREVPGCDDAYVYPLRRGMGTTDVIIISAGGLPSLELVEAVQDHIDELRPCGLNTLTVLAPVLVAQDHEIQVKLSGTSLAEITPVIDAAIDSYYDNLVPGDPYIKSAVESLISALPGVIDRAIVAPVGNVIPTVDATTVEWVRKGTVTVTLMP